MTIYEVQKDIEIQLHWKTKEAVFPTGKLEVNEGFLFPYHKVTNVRSSARYWHLKTGAVFYVGKHGDNKTLNVQGVCKRIE